ncbi:MAG TPA: hypothetical protein PLD25_26355 [Chloroflexota bacterium]|nr:hypothetical protein [Chloroflexota bacterium]HUM69097.1 hypothetical protein [Chloroflexota bacterium]
MTGQDSSSQQINRLRGQLHQVEAEIDNAEGELVRLEEDLRTFEYEFEATVGYLLEQLMRLEEEVNAYLQQIKILRTEQTFGEGYRTVEDQYNATWNIPRQEEAKKQPPKPPPLTAAKLKKLYRDLARRYHPDLALDEADRVLRTAKMMAINDAYKAGSLVEMMALAEEKEGVAQAGMGQMVGGTAVPISQTEDDLIQALAQELENRRRHLYRVQDALRNFHNRPMVELALEVRFARQQGRDLLAEMATETQRKIARKEVERDMIQSQFNSMY